MSKFLIALKALGHWFERQKRILPWREDSSIYRVWISEIMLQQTQVITVIPYFERFIARFPTVAKLAQASEEEVLTHWAGLGYYSRARNLHRGAKLIAARKKFPTTLEGWLEIPGVGDYTAGAILSIACDQVEPILDGNVERVLSRIRRVDREKGDTFFKEKLWRLAEITVQQASSLKIRPSVVNQALMELGATVCTPRNPRCEECPVSKICLAKATGKQEAYPPRKKPKQWIAVREEVECWVRTTTGLKDKELSDTGLEVLLRFREKGEWRSGLWDLPEAKAQAADKNGISEKTARFCGKTETRHIVTRHKIQRSTSIWQVKKRMRSTLKAADYKPSPSSHAQDTFKWVSLHSPDVPLGSAAKKTLEEVRTLLRDAEFFEFGH